MLNNQNSINYRNTRIENDTKINMGPFLSSFSAKIEKVCMFLNCLQWVVTLLRPLLVCIYCLYYSYIVLTYSKLVGHIFLFICQIIFVTNISLILLVRFDTLQLATGATGLWSQGATAVIHGCSIRALGPILGETTLLVDWAPSTALWN